MIAWWKTVRHWALLTLCLSYESIHNIPDPNNPSKYKRSSSKNLLATLLFLDSSKAFDSIHREKMEQIFLAYSFPKETLTAIMMLYSNTKVHVHALDGDIDTYEIVAGVLQEGAFVPYQFIICLDYGLRTSIELIKENGFTLKKKKQGADDNLQKLLRTQTIQMTSCFLQIHLPKPNPCCIAWSRQQAA